MITPKIKATNLEITDKMRRRVEKRLKDAYKVIPDNKAALAEVELEKTTNHHENGEIYRAEVNFTIAGNLHRSEATATDINTAIDEMRNSLVRELRKSKERTVQSRRKGGAQLKNLLRRLAW